MLPTRYRRADDHKARPIDGDVFDMRGKDGKTIAFRRHGACHSPHAAIAPFGHHARGACRIVVCDGMKPPVPRKEDAALSECHRMAVHLLYVAQRRAERGEEAQVNRHAQFTALRDRPCGIMQRANGHVHGADNGILHRDHGKVSGAMNDARDGVREGAAGNRRGTGRPLLTDGEFTERTKLTLKGDARLKAGWTGYRVRCLHGAYPMGLRLAAGSAARVRAFSAGRRRNQLATR